MLLSGGASVRTRTIDGETPALCALAEGYADLAEVRARTIAPLTRPRATPGPDGREAGPSLAMPPPLLVLIGPAASFTPY